MVAVPAYQHQQHNTTGVALPHWATSLSPMGRLCTIHHTVEPHRLLRCSPFEGALSSTMWQQQPIAYCTYARADTERH